MYDMKTSVKNKRFRKPASESKRSNLPAIQRATAFSGMGFSQSEVGKSIASANREFCIGAKYSAKEGTGRCSLARVPIGNMKLRKEIVRLMDFNEENVEKFIKTAKKIGQSILDGEYGEVRDKVMGSVCQTLKAVHASEVVTSGEVSLLRVAACHRVFADERMNILALEYATNRESRDSHHLPPVVGDDLKPAYIERMVSVFQVSGKSNMGCCLVSVSLRTPEMAVLQDVSELLSKVSDTKQRENKPKKGVGKKKNTERAEHALQNIKSRLESMSAARISEVMTDPRPDKLLIDMSQCKEIVEDVELKTQLQIMVKASLRSMHAKVKEHYGQGENIKTLSEKVGNFLSDALGVEISSYEEPQTQDPNQEDGDLFWLSSMKVGVRNFFLYFGTSKISNKMTIIQSYAKERDCEINNADMLYLDQTTISGDDATSSFCREMKDKQNGHSSQVVRDFYMEIPHVMVQHLLMVAAAEASAASCGSGDRGNRFEDVRSDIECSPATMRMRALRIDPRDIVKTEAEDVSAMSARVAGDVVIMNTMQSEHGAITTPSDAVIDYRKASGSCAEAGSSSGGERRSISIEIKTTRDRRRIDEERRVFDISREEYSRRGVTRMLIFIEIIDAVPASRGRAAVRASVVPTVYAPLDIRADLEMVEYIRRAVESWTYEDLVADGGEVKESKNNLLDVLPTPESHNMNTPAIHQAADIVEPLIRHCRGLAVNASAYESMSGSGRILKMSPVSRSREVDELKRRLGYLSSVKTEAKATAKRYGPMGLVPFGIYENHEPRQVWEEVLTYKEILNNKMPETLRLLQTSKGYSPDESNSMEAVVTEYASEEGVSVVGRWKNGVMILLGTFTKSQVDAGVSTAEGVAGIDARSSKFFADVRSEWSFSQRDKGKASLPKNVVFGGKGLQGDDCEEGCQCKTCSSSYSDQILDEFLLQFENMCMRDTDETPEDDVELVRSCISESAPVIEAHMDKEVIPGMDREFFSLLSAVAKVPGMAKYIVMSFGIATFLHRISEACKQGRASPSVSFVTSRTGHLAVVASTMNVSESTANMVEIFTKTTEWPSLYVTQLSSSNMLTEGGGSNTLPAGKRVVASEDGGFLMSWGMMAVRPKIWAAKSKNMLASMMTTVMTLVSTDSFMKCLRQGDFGVVNYFESEDGIFSTPELSIRAVTRHPTEDVVKEGILPNPVSTQYGEVQAVKFLSSSGGVSLESAEFAVPYTEQNSRPETDLSKALEVALQAFGISLNRGGYTTNTNAKIAEIEEYVSVNDLMATSLSSYDARDLTVLRIDAEGIRQLDDGEDIIRHLQETLEDPSYEISCFKTVLEASVEDIPIDAWREDWQSEEPSPVRQADNYSTVRNLARHYMCSMLVSLEPSTACEQMLGKYNVISQIADVNLENAIATFNNHTEPDRWPNYSCLIVYQEMLRSFYEVRLADSDALRLEKRKNPQKVFLPRTSFFGLLCDNTQSCQAAGMAHKAHSRMVTSQEEVTRMMFKNFSRTAYAWDGEYAKIKEFCERERAVTESLGLPECSDVEFYGCLETHVEQMEMYKEWCEYVVAADDSELIKPQSRELARVGLSNMEANEDFYPRVGGGFFRGPFSGVTRVNNFACFQLSFIGEPEGDGRGVIATRKQNARMLQFWRLMCYTSGTNFCMPSTQAFYSRETWTPAEVEEAWTKMRAAKVDEYFERPIEDLGNLLRAGSSVPGVTPGLKLLQVEYLNSESYFMKEAEAMTTGELFCVYVKRHRAATELYKKAFLSQDDTGKNLTLAERTELTWLFKNSVMVGTESVFEKQSEYAGSRVVQSGNLLGLALAGTMIGLALAKPGMYDSRKSGDSKKLDLARSLNELTGNTNDGYEVMYIDEEGHERRAETTNVFMMPDASKFGPNKNQTCLMIFFSQLSSSLKGRDEKTSRLVLGGISAPSQNSMLFPVRMMEALDRYMKSSRNPDPKLVVVSNSFKERHCAYNPFPLAAMVGRRPQGSAEGVNNSLDGFRVYSIVRNHMENIHRQLAEGYLSGCRIYKKPRDNGDLELVSDVGTAPDLVEVDSIVGRHKMFMASAGDDLAIGLAVWTSSHLKVISSATTLALLLTGFAVSAKKCYSYSGARSHSYITMVGSTVSQKSGRKPTYVPNPSRMLPSFLSIEPGSVYSLNNDLVSRVASGIQDGCGFFHPMFCGKVCRSYLKQFTRESSWSAAKKLSEWIPDVEVEVLNKVCRVMLPPWIGGDLDFGPVTLLATQFGQASYIKRNTCLNRVLSSSAKTVSEETKGKLARFADAVVFLCSGPNSPITSAGASDVVMGDLALPDRSISSRSYRMIQKVTERVGSMATGRQSRKSGISSVVRSLKMGSGKKEDVQGAFKAWSRMSNEKLLSFSVSEGASSLAVRVKTNSIVDMAIGLAERSSFVMTLSKSGYELEIGSGLATGESGNVTIRVSDYVEEAARIRKDMGPAMGAPANLAMVAMQNGNLVKSDTLTISSATREVAQRRDSRNQRVTLNLVNCVDHVQKYGFSSSSYGMTYCEVGQMTDLLSSYYGLDLSKLAKDQREKSLRPLGFFLNISLPSSTSTVGAALMTMRMMTTSLVLSERDDWIVPTAASLNAYSAAHAAAGPVIEKLNMVLSSFGMMTLNYSNKVVSKWMQPLKDLYMALLEKRAVGESLKGAKHPRGYGSEVSFNQYVLAKCILGLSENQRTFVLKTDVDYFLRVASGDPGEVSELLKSLYPVAFNAACDAQTRDRRLQRDDIVCFVEVSFDGSGNPAVSYFVNNGTLHQYRVRSRMFSQTLVPKLCNLGSDVVYPDLGDVRSFMMTYDLAGHFRESFALRTMRPPRTRGMDVTVRKNERAKGPGELLEVRGHPDSVRKVIEQHLTSEPGRTGSLGAAGIAPLTLVGRKEMDDGLGNSFSVIGLPYIAANPANESYNGLVEYTDRPGDAGEAEVVLGNGVESEMRAWEWTSVRVEGAWKPDGSIRYSNDVACPAYSKVMDEVVRRKLAEEARKAVTNSITLVESINLASSTESEEDEPASPSSDGGSVLDSVAGDASEAAAAEDDVWVDDNDLKDMDW
jgi:hypothetical protein